MMGWLRTYLGQLFSVGVEQGQKRLEHLLYLFVILVICSIYMIFTNVYRADAENPFNVPTVIGIFLSLIAFYWSVAISLAQKEISAKQEEQTDSLARQTALIQKQNQDIEGVMAAVQKYCTDLHSALYHIHEDIVSSISGSVDAATVVISLYTSSLSLGCISDPVEEDGHHSLDYFYKIISSIVDFTELRKSNAHAVSTELHLYVWKKDKHYENFSIEGMKYSDAIQMNREKTLLAIAKMKEIFDIYAGGSGRRGHKMELYLHSTGVDTVRFFQVEKTVGTAKLNTVESSMILMMPSITIGPSREGHAIVPDLSCMALWDGTERGRERMGKFFEHYKRSCCELDGVDACDEHSRAAAKAFSRDTDAGMREYFGNKLFDG